MKEVISLDKDLASFSPKQKEADKAIEKYKYIFYGVAKYGGKSHWLRWELIKLLARWAKKGFYNTRVGLFCENYPALKDRQITKIKKEFPRWLGELKDDKIEGLSFVLKKQFGGGILALRNLDDPSKYSSAEFAAIGIDELQRNEESVFNELRSIMRWPEIEDVKFLGTGMPGGIGHHFVKKNWIDRTNTEDPEYNQFYCVRAYAKDNPKLSQGYLDQLKSLPEKLRKAYLEGNWDVFEGQYFTEWDREKHVIIPFPIPLSWRRFRAYDHGRTAPACCKWYALDQDGRLWAYRELYITGQNIDQIATEINRLSQGESYVYSIADPSIFASLGFIDKTGGQTIAEVFARYEIQFYPGSNRRIDGWNILHQYLYWKEGLAPKLLHFNTCYNSIRTLPALIHDDKKPEDVDTDCEDHAPDCDRYMLMSLHESKTELPKTEIEQKLDQMKQKDSMIENLMELYIP